MKEDVSKQNRTKRDLADLTDGFPRQPAQLSRYPVSDRICHLFNSELLLAFGTPESELSRSPLN
jgi:hypothetical protein